MRAALLATAVALGCGSHQSRPAEPADPCREPDRSWLDWRDQVIAEMLVPRFRARGKRYVDTTDLAERGAVIEETIAQCEDRDPGRFGPGGALHQPLANLRRFASAWAWRSRAGHELGLTVADDAYIDDVADLVALPPLLRSPAFLRAVAAPATYRDAHRMIEDRNRAHPDDPWTVLLYQSRFIKTPDETTYGRFFVLVPGAVDRWIQYGIELPGQPVDRPIRGTSIVAVGPDRTAIVDYWRPSAGELTTRVEAEGGGSNCYNCHKAAVLPIRPAATYGFDDGGALVEQPADDIVAALNDRIEEYGPPRFAGALDPAAFGPPLGPVGRPRTDAFMRACAGDLPAASRARVDRAMGCAGCHDGVDLGAINVPQAIASDQDVRELLDPATGDSRPLVDTFILEGWMPPDSDLTPAERAALVRCLKRDYFDPTTNSGVLVEWLRGQPARLRSNHSASAAKTR